MLVRKADNSTIAQCDWTTAKFYCLMLNHKGQTDWRLPNYAELRHLIIRNKVPLGSYWSSTTRSGAINVYAITIDTDPWGDTIVWYPNLKLARETHSVLPIRTFIPNQYKKKK